MKTNLLKSILSGILATSVLALGVSGDVEARGGNHKMDHKMIKVMSDQDKDVSVFVKGQTGKHKYVFERDELENLDNVRAELGDLDEATLDKVVNLLAQLDQHNEAVVEFKDMEMSFDDKHTEIFVLKKGDNEDKLRVEVDVEGDGADPDNHFRVAKVLGKTLGDHRVVHQHVKERKGPHMMKLLKRMINKAELTQEEVDELKRLLDEK